MVMQLDKKTTENWATPTLQDGKNCSGESRLKRNSKALYVQVEDYPESDCDREPFEMPTASGQWPTPSACVANDGEKSATWKVRRDKLKHTHQNGNGAGMPLSVAVQQGEPVGNLLLNPDWVEQLMGFPIGWTDLN